MTHSVCVSCQSGSEAGRARRITAGGQQPGHQPVHLVLGEHDVPQQHADQPGQPEPHRGRRMHQPDTGTHRLCQHVQQFVESERIRPGRVDDEAVIP